jgi:hypothetical protein
MINLRTVKTVIIHMSEAVEREELVQAAEQRFPNACRMEAKRGVDFLEKYAPGAHPKGVGQQPIPLGAMGCAESHFTALAERLADTIGSDDAGDASSLLVLEDDAEWLGTTEEMEAWANSVPMDWDILLLGTTENVEKTKLLSFSTAQVWRFWGTHAVLFRNKDVIEKVLFTYDRLLREGTMPLADWWYSFAIKEHGLNAYSPLPCKRFVQQKQGLVSYITGKARS